MSLSTMENADNKNVAHALIPPPKDANLQDAEWDNLVSKVTPHHYARWKIEPITFCMMNKVPFAVGNVIKYVMRYDMKEGLEDLKKARRYIDMIIEMEYGKDKL